MRCRIQQWSSWRWSQPSWRGDFLPLQLMMCVVESREPGIRIKGWEVLPTVCIVGLLVINSRFLLEPLSTCECHCGGLQDEKTRHVVGFILQQEIDLQYCSNTTAKNAMFWSLNPCGWTTQEINIQIERNVQCRKHRLRFTISPLTHPPVPTLLITTTKK